MAPDHHHECLHCGDVWLCALETDEWTGSLARVLMAETEETIRRILRRRER